MKRVIYGIGKYGKLLFDLYREDGILIDFFAQSEKSDEADLQGIKILSFEEMMDIKEDLIILIAIKNYSVARKIIQSVADAGDTGKKAYYLGGFIEENLVWKKHAIVQTGKYYCNVCNNQVEKFEPFGLQADIYMRLHIVGGGVRENCICPYCGASDRERWLQFVIEKHTDLGVTKANVLHLAPEKSLSDHIRANGKTDYYRGDIVFGKTDHVVDITDIQFKDSFFDYVICNHVMEHIMDESAAVSEIKRVLKPGGKLIMSFPICTDIETTYEDDSVSEPLARLEAYGQEDHVRLYGKDYKEHFEKYNLKLTLYRPIDLLSSKEIISLGLIENDVVIIAEKRDGIYE